MDHGARVDWIIPGKLDRGGAINLISPDRTISKNCAGMATSGYLVEVEKVSMAQMEEWKKQYPEAFEREYDPASGLRFNAWVEGGYVKIINEELLLSMLQSATAATAARSPARTSMSAMTGHPMPSPSRTPGSSG